MDWYCLVFNSGEINGAGSAQYLYEKICEGDFSLVGDIDIIDNLYNELMEKNFKITADKVPGFIVIGCSLEDADFIDDFISELCKKHKLSYYEPQNMRYQF